MKRFHWIVLGALLLGSIGAACSNQPPDDGLAGVQSLITGPNRTATRAAIKTATAASWISIRATKTADYLPTGRQSLVDNYTEWQLAGTLVARQTATPTATSTPTRTPTPTFTPTPTRTPTPTP